MEQSQAAVGQESSSRQAEGPAAARLIEDDTRSARKHHAIIDAATALFLQHGYQGTSMDQVAADAAVSKQTVYKHFAHKETLFREVILGISGTVDQFIADVTDTLSNPSNLDDDLRGLAHRYLAAVLQPQILQLRRLMIGEAGRFPELGRDYYQRGPERVIAVLADAFDDLAKGGLLHFADPVLAARHFAFLILSIPLDRALVCGDVGGLSQEQLENITDAGVAVFLAAYMNPRPA